MSPYISSSQGFQRFFFFILNERKPWRARHENEHFSFQANKCVKFHKNPFSQFHYAKD